MGIREHLAVIMERYPVIWLPSHEEHYDNDKRAAAWNEIIDLLIERGIAADLEDVKMKWKAMRSGYTKSRKGKSGQAATRTGIFRLMTYLDQAEVDAPRLSNLRVSDDEEVRDENASPSTSTSQDESRKRLFEEDEIPLLGQKKKTPKRSRAETSEDRGVLREAIQNVKDKMEAVEKCDKFTTFGTFVAQNLRGMDEKRANEKMYAIMTTLVTEVKHVSTPEEFRKSVEEGCRPGNRLPTQVFGHFDERDLEQSFHDDF